MRDDFEEVKTYVIIYHRRENDINLEYEVVKCLRQILNTPVSIILYEFSLNLTHLPIVGNKRSADT
jgi:hypothetical protein